MNRSNSNCKKHLKPMLGSLTVVGRDSDGRKLILPLSEHIEHITGVNNDQMIKEKSKWSSFFGKVVSLFKKNKYKEALEEVYITIKAKDANWITRNYMKEVNEILAPLTCVHPKPHHG